jgi:acetate kinase
MDILVLNSGSSSQKACRREIREPSWPSISTFTAGGENCPQVRAAACEGLDFIGVAIDANKNTTPSLDADISSPGSRVKVLVIRAEGDWAIAGECWRLSRSTAV